MSVGTTDVIEPLVRRKEESVVDSEDKRGQSRIVLAAMLAVILLDQAMKWWAWRHVSDVTINPGGTLLLGRTIGGLYADPRRGALLDLLDVGLLSTAVSVLVRRRRPAVVLVLGALMIGGWTSNLFDRLGLHYWTAPGSIRGAVDFIHVDRKYYNVADFVIAATTLLQLLTVGYLSWRAASHPTVAGSTTGRASRHAQARAQMSALTAAAGLVVVVVSLGATHYGGVTAPQRPTNTYAYTCASYASNPSSSACW